MLRPYLRISPHWLEQTRLQPESICQHIETTKQSRVKPPLRLSSYNCLNLLLLLADTQSPLLTNSGEI